MVPGKIWKKMWELNWLQTRSGEQNGCQCFGLPPLPETNPAVNTLQMPFCPEYFFFFGKNVKKRRNLIRMENFDSHCFQLCLHFTFPQFPFLSFPVRSRTVIGQFCLLFGANECQKGLRISVIRYNR